MNRLKELRDAAGWSQMKLAKESGISTTTIVFVEKYDHTPGGGIQTRIAEALGTTVEEIWMGEGK